MNTRIGAAVLALTTTLTRQNNAYIAYRPTNTFARRRHHLLQSQSQQQLKHNNASMEDPLLTSSRRRFFSRTIASVFAASVTGAALAPTAALRVQAAEETALAFGRADNEHTFDSSSSSSSTTKNSDWTQLRAPVVAAVDTLQKLLDNWENAIIDCTYADVPRELLEQKNKALLLEKAATSALFDKSGSVVSCKTVVGPVRDYLGRTGIGPAAALDKSLKTIVTRVLNDDTVKLRGAATDNTETFLQTVEDAAAELNRADSLSYSARRDFSSMNNFDPDITARVLADPASNLALCKAAIQNAVQKLRVVLDMLPHDA